MKILSWLWILQSQTLYPPLFHKKSLHLFHSALIIQKVCIKELNIWTCVSRWFITRNLQENKENYVVFLVTFLQQTGSWHKFRQTFIRRNENHYVVSNVGLACSKTHYNQKLSFCINKSSVSWMAYQPLESHKIRNNLVYTLEIVCVFLWKAKVRKCIV